MANELRMAGNVTALQDVGGAAGTIEGETYTNLQHDKNANSKSWGGRYDLPAYDDDGIAYYSSSVVAEDGASDGLDASGWQEGAAGPTDGTLPATVQLIAVEYVSELGTVGNVNVSLQQSGETAICLASLDLGESVVIPIYEGLPLAEVLIGAGAYDDGTNEATVNVLIAGQNA